MMPLPPPEPPITTATLDIDSNGAFMLRYYFSTGQICASLITYYESDARQDWEVTKRIEPQVRPSRISDHRVLRDRKRRVLWFT